jgi:hypothetical protein
VTGWIEEVRGKSRVLGTKYEVVTGHSSLLALLIRKLIMCLYTKGTQTENGNIKGRTGNVKII